MKRIIFINTLYIFLFVSGSAYGIVDEKSIVLGGEARWNIAEHRLGVIEIPGLRPHPVLTLCSAAAGGSFSRGSSLDLYLSFNEGARVRDNTGRYRVTALPEFQIADARFARTGSGAALFAGSPLVIEPQSRNALFSPGHIKDFTIEFWLHPFNLGNGDIILSWAASKNNNAIQRIQTTAFRNRLQWSFVNFFSSANGVYRNIELSGSTPIVPRTWSHHLIRFDAKTGMIEYLVNGNSEAIVYATPTGRESGEVYTPVIGSNGAFLLGERFTGMMNEFKIHNAFASRDLLDRYAPAGGRIETRAIDLGCSSSAVLRVNASGGRAANGRAAVRSNMGNEFRENGRFHFSDDSEMNFSIRFSDNPWLFDESPWINFIPGMPIAVNTRGRYVQLAVDFFPSADGYSSPFLSELRVVYAPGRPPLPPRNLTATAVDGGVILSWRSSPSANVSGYMVYYSSVRGELFGTHAALGASPIDVGNTTSILIDGLRNGTLYYFRVAAYEDTSNTRIVGDFSREVTARPLAGAGSR